MIDLQAQAVPPAAEFAAPRPTRGPGASASGPSPAQGVSGFEQAWRRALDDRQAVAAEGPGEGRPRRQPDDAAAAAAPQDWQDRQDRQDRQELPLAAILDPGVAPALLLAAAAAAPASVAADVPGRSTAPPWAGVPGGQVWAAGGAAGAAGAAGPDTGAADAGPQPAAPGAQQDTGGRQAPGQVAPGSAGSLAAPRLEPLAPSRAGEAGGGLGAEAPPLPAQAWTPVSAAMAEFLGVQSGHVAAGAGGWPAPAAAAAPPVPLLPVAAGGGPFVVIANPGPAVPVAGAQAATAAAPSILDLDLRSAELGPLRIELSIGREGVAHLAVQVADEAARQSLLDRREQLAHALSELGLQLSLELNVNLGAQTGKNEADARGDGAERGASPGGAVAAAAGSAPRAWSAQAWAAVQDAGARLPRQDAPRVHLYA
jgi:hypothetical protein